MSASGPRGALSSSNKAKSLSDLHVQKATPPAAQLSKLGASTSSLDVRLVNVLSIVALNLCSRLSSIDLARAMIYSASSTTSAPHLASLQIRPQSAPRKRPSVATSLSRRSSVSTLRSASSGKSRRDSAGGRPAGPGSNLYATATATSSAMYRASDDKSMYVAGPVSALEASRSLLAHSLEWKARSVMGEELTAAGSPAGMDAYKAAQARTRMAQHEADLKVTMVAGQPPPRLPVTAADTYDGSKHSQLRVFSPYDAVPLKSEQWEYSVMAGVQREREADVARQAVDQSQAIREEVSEFGGEWPAIEEGGGDGGGDSDDSGGAQNGGDGARGGAATMRSSATAARRRSLAFFASDAASTVLGGGSVAGGASTMYMRVRSRGSRTGSKRIVATPTVIPLLNGETGSPGGALLPPFIRPDPNSHTDGVVASMREMGGEARPLETLPAKEQILDSSARALPPGVTDDADEVALLHQSLRAKYGQWLYVQPAAAGSASLQEHDAQDAPISRPGGGGAGGGLGVMGVPHGAPTAAPDAADAVMRARPEYRQDALLATFSNQWAKAYAGFADESVPEQAGTGSPPPKRGFNADPNFALLASLPADVGMRARLSSLWNTWADAWESEARTAVQEHESGTTGKAKAAPSKAALATTPHTPGKKQPTEEEIAKAGRIVTAKQIAAAAEGAGGRENAEQDAIRKGLVWSPAELDDIGGSAEHGTALLEEGKTSSGGVGSIDSLVVRTRHGDAVGVLRGLAVASSPCSADELPASLPAAAASFRGTAASLSLRTPGGDAYVPSVYSGANSIEAPGAAGTATARARTGSNASLNTGSPLHGSAPRGLYGGGGDGASTVRSGMTQGSTHPLTAGGAEVTYDAMNVLSMTTPTLVASAMVALNGLLDALTTETSMTLADAAVGTSTYEGEADRGGSPLRGGSPTRARSGSASGGLVGGGLPGSPRHRAPSVGAIPEEKGGGALAAADEEDDEIGGWGLQGGSYDAEARLRDEKAAAARGAAVTARKVAALEKADRLSAMSHRVQTVRVAVAEMANRWRRGTALALKSLSQLEHDLSVKDQALQQVQQDRWESERSMDALQSQVAALKHSVMQDLIDVELRKGGQGGSSFASPPRRFAPVTRHSIAHTSPNRGVPTPLSLAGTPPSMGGQYSQAVGSTPSPKSSGARKLVRRSMTAATLKQNRLSGKQSPLRQRAALQALHEEQQAAHSPSTQNTDAAQHVSRDSPQYAAAVAAAEARVQAALQTPTVRQGSPTAAASPQERLPQVLSAHKAAHAAEAASDFDALLESHSEVDAVAALQAAVRQGTPPAMAVSNFGGAASPSPQPKQMTPSRFSALSALGGARGGGKAAAPADSDALRCMLDRIEATVSPARSAARHSAGGAGGSVISAQKPHTSPAASQQAAPPPPPPMRKVLASTTRITLSLSTAAHKASTCVDLWDAVAEQLQADVERIDLVLDDAALEAMHGADTDAKRKTRRYSKLSVSTRSIPKAPLPLTAAGVPLNPTLQVSLRH